MDIFTVVLIIVGLCLFEVISSIDNAIINADVLATISKPSRKWFFFLGMFFAVFVVRGLLPWLVLWASNPSLGPIGSFLHSFSSDPQVIKSIEVSSPILLAGAATFLLFLFFHWLFLEPKNALFFTEKFFQSNFYLFYSFVSVMLLAIVWMSLKISNAMALSAVIGATVFYLAEGIRTFAEEKAKKIHIKGFSDAGKIAYLEVLDATFSVDGVVGAFAFTLSVPLILIGNGIGALVVRQLTIKNLSIIKKLKYLKKGAMYSIFVLAVIMLANSFGYLVPKWVPPVSTFAIVGFFFYISYSDLRRNKLIG